MNYSEEENKMSLKLFKYCKKNKIEKVEELINKHNIDPNYCGDEGTPLTWAVKNGSLSLVMILLQSPLISVNQPDTGGYTPLILACMHDYKLPDQNLVNNYHIIRKLLLNSPGIDINIQDLAGNTPLMISALTDDKDIVKELLMTGAAIDLFNSMGMTALHNAATINSSEVVSLLLSYGAKSMKDNTGNLPSDLSTNDQVLKLLSGKKTSVSHPFRLDFIDRTLCPNLNDARVGMCMCPGREWNEWSRDFEADLKVVVENKVDVVASIITHTELKQMNYHDFYDRIRKFGLESIEYSIHDKWVPNSLENFMKVVDKIVEYLRQEKTVLVHCNGGRGRTGLIVAASIIIFGYTSEQAIQMVRTARSGMLRNPAQEFFLHTFESKLQNNHHNSTAFLNLPVSNPVLLGVSAVNLSSSGGKKSKLSLLRKQSLTSKKRDYLVTSDLTLPRSKTKTDIIIPPTIAQRKFSTNSRLDRKQIPHSSALRRVKTPPRPTPSAAYLQDIILPALEADIDDVLSITERPGPNKNTQIPIINNELSPVLSRRSTTDEN